MFRVNEDGRFWLFVLAVASCVAFIPFIVMSPGGIMIGFLITVIVVAVASTAGAVSELKKIKRPEQKTWAKIMEIGVSVGDDMQGADMKDMINLANYAANYAKAEFADETTHKLYFHSSKLKKILPEYKNKNVKLYYKEHNEKYWFVGFGSTGENNIQEGPSGINFGKPLAILSIILSVILITFGVLQATGVVESLSDQMSGKVKYSEFEVKPLSEFYAEFSVTHSGKTEKMVCAVNSDTVYFYFDSDGIEIFLDKDENGDVICVYARDDTGEVEETMDAKYIEGIQTQFLIIMEVLDVQRTLTEEEFKRLKVDKLGTEKIAGRECVSYSFKGNNIEILVWIDQKTNYMMKLERETASILVEKFMESGFEIPAYK